MESLQLMRQLTAFALGALCAQSATLPLQYGAWVDLVRYLLRSRDGALYRLVGNGDASFDAQHPAILQPVYTAPERATAGLVDDFNPVGAVVVTQLLSLGGFW